MKHLIVLIAVMALSLGCGKSEKDPHEGHNHGATESHEGHDHGKPGAKAPESAGGEHAEGGERVGPGLAVEAYEIEEGRIKLSEKAVKRLGLKMEKAVFRNGAVQVPPYALGNEDGEPFVYVQEPDRWFKRVFVTVGPRSGDGTIVLAGLSSGTEFVSRGASFVRLAELDLLAGDAVDSCGGH